MSEYKCPNCKETFEGDSVFWWGIDDNGDPCVENVSCPNCKASTVALFSCDQCHQSFKCEREEECPPCQVWRYEEFEEAE